MKECTNCQVQFELLHRCQGEMLYDIEELMDLRSFLAMHYSNNSLLDPNEAEIKALFRHDKRYLSRRTRRLNLMESKQKMITALKDGIAEPEITNPIRSMICQLEKEKEDLRMQIALGLYHMVRDGLWEIASENPQQLPTLIPHDEDLTIPGYEHIHQRLTEEAANEHQ